jgi:hypothetical protein
VAGGVLQKVNSGVNGLFRLPRQVRKTWTATRSTAIRHFPARARSIGTRFSEDDHRRLAHRLAEFRRAMVVCRFYRHPLIEELYPAGLWQWHEFTGRKQSNGDAPEVLLTNDAKGRLFA